MDQNTQHSHGLMVEFTDYSTGASIWIDRANITGFQSSVSNPQGKCSVVQSTTSYLYKVKGSAAQLAAAQNQWLQLQTLAEREAIANAVAQFAGKLSAATSGQPSR